MTTVSSDIISERRMSVEDIKVESEIVNTNSVITYANDPAVETITLATMTPVPMPKSKYIYFYNNKSGAYEGHTADTLILKEYLTKDTNHQEEYNDEALLLKEYSTKNNKPPVKLEDNINRDEVPWMDDELSSYPGPLSMATSALLNNSNDVTAIYPLPMDDSENIPRIISYQNPDGLITTGLTDLPSPDSGIGVDVISSREPARLQNAIEYSKISDTTNSIQLDNSTTSNDSVSPLSFTTVNSEPYPVVKHDTNKNKINIPVMYSQFGFKYSLETSISINQRLEDDRVSYINKGQYYEITMEYIVDPESSEAKLKTVKSVLILTMRDETPENELKIWQYWHNRQHSSKQRMLDIDIKNSVGIGSSIEEIANNAIVFYWNPQENSVKLSIAVQCLSTDFSNQKGIRGVPLHLQIDTYENSNAEAAIVHRGYCQIKVYCDKGAERKMRDEMRKADKRSTQGSVVSKSYHFPNTRSEFYSMIDLIKKPVLFIPEADKLLPINNSGMDILDTTNENLELNENPPNSTSSNTVIMTNNEKVDTKLLDQSYKFVLKKTKIPSPIERIMLFVRQPNEHIFTPLHLVPPTTFGLINAIVLKYNINASDIVNLFRRNNKGVLARIDDDMLKYYCNEDTFLVEFVKSENGDGLMDIFFTELNL